MNTKFSVATHILTFLQTQAGKPATSELIASSVNTNPSLIRRLLGQLAKAGLTTSIMGTGGGALLAKSGDSITLLDVYLAIGDDNNILPIHQEPNPRCIVGRNIQVVLKMQIEAAERALRDQLATCTIAEMAHSVEETDRTNPARKFQIS
jgi:Rrf2 family protein